MFGVFSTLTFWLLCLVPVKENISHTSSGTRTGWGQDVRTFQTSPRQQSKRLLGFRK